MTMIVLNQDYNKLLTDYRKCANKLQHSAKLLTNTYLNNTNDLTKSFCAHKSGFIAAMCSASSTARCELVLAFASIVNWSSRFGHTACKQARDDFKCRVIPESALLMSDGSFFDVVALFFLALLSSVSINAAGTCCRTRSPRRWDVLPT